MKSGARIAERYELLDRLARGGMGEVWTARHLGSGREVALKLIPARGGEGAAERFEQEVTAPAKVDHPGVVQVLDAGRDGAQWFIAMEKLRGEPLRASLERGEDVVRLLRDALDPLAALHAASLVHRDIKPENLFVTERGVRLLDFGIAAAAGDDERASGRGTAAYLAPEQALDPSAVGPATDVWAVGVILYEALAGRHPFDAETGEGMILRACTEPHPALEAAPAALAALVDRCLAKAPRDRPGDAAALAQALDRALGDEGSESQRRRAVALGVALGVAAAGIAGWQLLRAPQPPPSAAAPLRPPPVAAPSSAAPLEPTTWDLAVRPDTVPEPPVARPPARRVAGDGWSFALPAGWYAIPAEPPHVLRRYAAPDPLEGYRPNVALVSEPWTGTLYDYGGALMNRDYRDGQMMVLSRNPLTVSGRWGELIEAVFDHSEPPYQMVGAFITDGRNALLLACNGPRPGFAELRKTCQGIAASLRLGEEQ